VPRWFEQSRTNWDAVYQPDRIAHMVAEMRDLIALLEKDRAPL
jgi:benzoyl-CoA reductase subunit B